MFGVVVAVTIEANPKETVAMRVRTDGEERFSSVVEFLTSKMLKKLLTAKDPERAEF